MRFTRGLLAGLLLGPGRDALLGELLGPVFLPEPAHGPVGRLPLVLVDGAGQEALQAGALGGHAAADHLGDRAGDDHAGQARIEGGVGALHGALGAVAAEFLLGEARDHDRQLVRRQRVGVVQHRGHRQVLAAHRTVDDDLQALDRREDVDRAPVAAGSVVIEDQHHAISPIGFIRRPRSSGPAAAAAPPARRRRRSPVPTPSKKSRMASKRALLPSAALITVAREPAPGRAHQRAGRDQVGEVERRACRAPWPAAPPASCRWRGRA